MKEMYKTLVVIGNKLRKFFLLQLNVSSMVKFPVIALVLFMLFSVNVFASTETKSANHLVTFERNIEEPYFEGTNYKSPWEYMGTDVNQICSAILPYYEWGVRYNNDGPILRVTCNSWNSGYRVCTYPEYPTTDAEPFTWGGACWIWGTVSTLDDNCNSGYHCYFTQDANGRLNMAAGNGCGSLPGVYRRMF